MKKFVIFIVLACVNAQAQAIVNIETQRLHTRVADTGMDGYINLTVNGESGNTQTLSAGLATHLEWYSPATTELIIFSYDYGESNQVKDTDKQFLHFRKMWHMDKQFSWESYLQFESNAFTRLKLRALIGGGARYRLSVDNPSIESTLEGGLFYSKEQLDDSTVTLEQETDTTTRVNTYWIFKQAINKQARWINTIYFQPDIERLVDYRLLEQFSFQVDILDELSINLSLDVSRDNQPPVNVKNTDTAYSTSLEYRF